MSRASQLLDEQSQPEQPVLSRVELVKAAGKRMAEEEDLEALEAAKEAAAETLANVRVCVSL